MKKIYALWQFGRGSRTVPGVSLRKRSILCDLVIAGASLFYFGQGYAVAQDINSGLAGYWSCSDINDNTLADYSGNGHNGSFTGHPIWTVGKLTGALRFDGQTEYVTANNVLNTSQSFTAAAWVQLENELTYSTAFSQDGVNVSGFYLQYLSPTDSGLGSVAGKFAFALLNSDSTGAAPTRAVCPFAPVINTWYHLAGVYDSANSVIKFYVNGSLVATQSTTIGRCSRSIFNSMV
jgi:alpha-L-arabinofuranosidase